MAGVLLTGCGGAAAPAAASGAAHRSTPSTTHAAASRHAKAHHHRSTKLIQGTVTATTPSSVTITPVSGSPVTVTVSPRTRVRLAPSGSKAKPGTLLAVTKGAKVTIHAVATSKALRAALITVV